MTTPFVWRDLGLRRGHHRSGPGREPVGSELLPLRTHKGLWGVSCTSPISGLRRSLAYPFRTSETTNVNTVEHPRTTPKLLWYSHSRILSRTVYHSSLLTVTTIGNNNGLREWLASPVLPTDSGGSKELRFHPEPIPRRVRTGRGTDEGTTKDWVWGSNTKGSVSRRKSTVSGRRSVCGETRQSSVTSSTLGP